MVGDIDGRNRGGGAGLHESVIDRFHALEPLHRGRQIIGNATPAEAEDIVQDHFPDGKRGQGIIGALGFDERSDLGNDVVGSCVRYKKRDITLRIGRNSRSSEKMSTPMTPFVIVLGEMERRGCR